MTVGFDRIDRLSPTGYRAGELVLGGGVRARRVPSGRQIIGWSLGSGAAQTDELR